MPQLHSISLRQGDLLATPPVQHCKCRIELVQTNCAWTLSGVCSEKMHAMQSVS